MGVSLLSLLARGVYTSAQEAARQMIRTADLLSPDPQGVEAYRGVYRRYCRLDQASRPLFREI